LLNLKIFEIETTLYHIITNIETQQNIWNYFIPAIKLYIFLLDEEGLQKLRRKYEVSPLQ